MRYKDLELNNGQFLQTEILYKKGYYYYLYLNIVTKVDRGGYYSIEYTPYGNGCKRIVLNRVTRASKKGLEDAINLYNSLKDQIISEHLLVNNLKLKEVESNEH